eukprot:CCRYP_010919-RA/>CCRYP_010919-RA protein AED:0.03 eAED:0.03 QI:456/1/1/1/1/1/5/369/1533
MITEKTMKRNSAHESSDSDSISSEERQTGKHAELMARASQILTGLGRGASLLNVQSNDGQGSLERNDLQERFLEAKQNNLFSGRGSGIRSEVSGIAEEDDLSLSDASTFEMPLGSEGETASYDNTGGTEPQLDEYADIDRLQLEIHASYGRALSGVTLSSLVSNASSNRSDRSDEDEDKKAPIMAALPFFGRGACGLVGKHIHDEEPSSIVQRKDTAGSSDGRAKGWLSGISSATDEAAGRRKSASWKLPTSLKQILLKEDSDDEPYTEDASKKQKAAAKLMHKHFQTANNPESFRELQKRMKEKGAFTETSVRALLQDVDFDSSDEDGEQGIGLELDHSFKKNFFASDLKPLTNEYSWQEGNADTDSKLDEIQQRLRNDPIFFGGIDQRPYIHLPSREPSLQFLANVIQSATDEGRATLLTVHGDRYLGKTKFIDAVVRNVQNQSQNSFTVLRSERSSSTAVISFFPFRKIVSSALRECNRKTEMGAKPHEETDGNRAREFDSSTIQRLIDQKLLDKSDQVMISRILPDVILESSDLLSLLHGRSPGSLTKDTADTLFKLMIPLQPILMVFDAVDGDGDIDSSSWRLMEQLLLSAPTSCPQMIAILISRQPLSIPSLLSGVTIDTSLKGITKKDSEEYIRALFDPNGFDKSMTVDENVLDIIRSRANGCPLFLERLVLWAQKRAIVEIDETRNAVAINVFHEHRSELNDILPATLIEEVLTELSSLPHNELDSLKTACCMGMIFPHKTYDVLESEGFFRLLHSLISSHHIFDFDDDWYKWRHSVVFDAVSSIIITDERQEIHERICDSFRRSSSTSCDVQRAKHYSIAHRWDEAWDQYMDAGKRSEKIFDYTHAVTCYNKAKQCLRERSSPREKIACSTALGWCLQALECYDEAEKELESSLEATMSLPENDREEEYSLLTALAKVKASQSKYSDAIKLYERALPIVDTKIHSPKWLAHHISSYGEILRKSGELKRAQSLHEEALKYRELALEDKSGTVLELSISHTQLGCTHSGLQEHEEASHYHKKALSARVSHLDFYHSLVSESLNYCADSLQALGRGKEAIPLAIHAVKIRKQLFGTSHPAYAHALSVLASSYYSIGRPLDTRYLLEECLDICDKVLSSNHSNLIPNLMLYGKVLRASGDMINATSVYKRALFIHNINFRADQNKIQLDELNRCIRELECGFTSCPKTSLEMPIPCIESDPGKAHIILCTNFGHRPCDAYAFSLASSLQQMGSVNLVTVVAVGQPQHECAQLARLSLDSLLLSDVPVAFSRVVSAIGKSRGTLQTSPYISSDGVEIITRVLVQAPSKKSLTIMCDYCLGDIAEVMEKHAILFAEKVKEVVIIGSVQPLRRRSNIEPEVSGNAEYDMFTSKVYAGCQQLNIQTVSMCKDVAKGFPFPSSYVDDLTQTNHMIGSEVQRKEKAQANLLWEQGTKDSRRYIFGHDKPQDGKCNAWPLVKSVNIELSLGLLCCIPMYRDAHFRWESHQVNGVNHKVCRHRNAKAGIIKSQNLSDEILNLVGFSLRAALLNTSC